MAPRPTTPVKNGKKKEKKYAIQHQNEREFISLDRETFKKSDDEKSDLLNHKQRIRKSGGKIKHHKFTTLVTSQF